MKARKGDVVRADHRDLTSAAAAEAEAMDQHAYAQRNDLLLQRTRIALAMVAGAVVLTTFVDLPASQVRPALLLSLKAVDLGLIALAFSLTRWTRTTHYATLVAWSVPTTVCAMLALSGIATGDPHGAVIMCVGAVLITASIFPWGVRAQLAAAACSGVAIAVSLYWTPGQLDIPVSYQAVAAAALTLAMSVVITYERQATWRAMLNENKARARAEAQTATLHRHLERVVSERTALLEATRRDLECQIVDYKATLVMLREKEQQLRDIVDNSSALIYVKDLDGRYRFVGIQGERLAHMRRDEMIGKTLADFLPAAAAATIAADDRAVLAANRAVEAERTIVHADGPRTYLSLKFPLRDAEGVNYGLCGIATDITPRKHMEDELRRAQALLASVIDSSNEAIWSLDRQYRFTALNTVVRQRFPELFGTRPEVGASLDDCLPPETRGYWHALYEQALSGTHLVIEHHITIGGTPRQVLVSLNPVHESGTVTGVVVFTKEITDFRRTAEELRQHQAELAHALRLSTLGEMATGLAQDLQRPLTAITRTVHACQREVRSGRIHPAAFVQRIGQVTAEALGAAESLRHLRRLVRKNSAPHGDIDVNEVTRNAVRIVEARHPKLPLQLALAPDLPQVHGDRIQLEQVILNLLLNALDAMQAVPTEARTLAVQTRLADGFTVEVAVRDTGAGLDPVLGEKMFAPFVSTKPKGLGMGLAISRSIVEAHGGHLWVTPNPEGGSTFRFTVPLP